MEVFQHTAFQMVILFLLIAGGFISHKTGLMNDKFDAVLSKLVMNVSMPCMICASVLNSDSLPSGTTIMQILWVSLLVYVLMVAAAEVIPRFYPRISENERGAHSFVIAFGNVGFIGFPVLSAVFGSQAVLYGAIFNIPYNFAVFTFGVMMLKRGAGDKEVIGAGKTSVRGWFSRLWKNLANPAMASCIIAPVLAVFGITDNGGIFGQAFQVMGQLTVPASMLVIGSSLAKMSFKDTVGHVAPYVTSAFRLLIMPMLVWLVFRTFVTDPLILGVLAVSSAMPAASLGAMLSLIYGGDIDTIMRCTFISTIFSLITIPLIAMLVI